METIDDLQQRVGRLLREARLKRDISQEELSRMSDVSSRSIHSIETGSGARLETFLRILRALDRLDMIDYLDEGYNELSPLEELRMMRGQPRRPQRASKKRAR